MRVVPNNYVERKNNTDLEGEIPDTGVNIRRRQVGYVLNGNSI